MKHSATGGVKPMTIAGRTIDERERLIGMTPEERAWRAQWLKDQHLSPNEPVDVPELYKEFNNPIRRFYKAPLNKLEAMLVPYMGPINAAICRHFVAKTSMAIAIIYCATYYLKYNANDWTRIRGWRLHINRPSCLPGDPGYPQISRRTEPEHYAARGFDKVTLNL